MASKSSLLSIVAWSLVGILLIGVGAMVFTGQKQAARAEGFRDALLQIGVATGVEELAAESLEGPESLPNVVQQLEGAILGDKQELLSTKSALNAAQTEASDARAEVTSLTQESEASKAKADSLSKELAAKAEQLDVAQADAKKADEALNKAKKAAEKKTAKLQKKVDGLKSELEEETARLQSDLDAALLRASEMETMDAAPVAEEDGMAVEEAEADAVAEEVVEEVEVEEEAGRIIGQSKMFSLIRYSEASGTLFFRLLDDQTLSYQDIPMDVADDLLMSEEKLDLKYRFNIQGAYKSLPPDSVVIRKYWKNSRYRAEAQDVRLIEDEALPEVVVEEEAVVEEETAVEADAVAVETEAVAEEE